MKKRHLLLYLFLGIFVGIPLLLHLAWTLTPPRELNIVVVNKTLDNIKDFRLQAYHWVLSHRKYYHRDGSIYKPENYHIGFIPMANKKFRIRDFENTNQQAITELLYNTDLLYFANNYGIYSHSWYNADHKSMPFYKVYGGLADKDIEAIQAMLNMNKAVIAEYNFFSPPTLQQQRDKAQELLGLQWQGWSGRYFPSLDSAYNDILPSWVVSLYKEQNQGRWPFKNQGIGFINEQGAMVILEYPTHLSEPSTVVSTEKKERGRFGVPSQASFPDWFEITFPSSGTSRVISWFEIPVTREGEKLLQQHNIPLKFPAVIENDSQGRFFYFAGDFGKTHVSDRFIRLKGARFLELMTTNLRDPSVRKGFFFSYYLPLTTSILKEISENEPPVKISQTP